MNHSMQKSLFSLAVITLVSVLCSTGLQAASFNKLMNLGIISADSSVKEVVIFSDDNTKCLSTNDQKPNSAKSLSYTECRLDGSDTWLITSAGKIKNKQSGKCLSTPNGEDRLVLAHCSAAHFRDRVAHDFVIFDHIVEGNHNSAEIAEVRH